MLRKSYTFCLLVSLMLCSVMSRASEQTESYSYEETISNELLKTLIAYDEKNCRFIASTHLEELGRYSLLAAACDNRMLAWLHTYEESPIKFSKRKIQVIDFLSAGTLTEGQFSFSPFCSVNKSQQHFEWVAIYRGEGRKKYTLKNGGIVQGWVINPTTKRFELASPEIMKNIECIPETYD